MSQTQNPDQKAFQPQEPRNPPREPGTWVGAPVVGRGKAPLAAAWAAGYVDAQGTLGLWWRSDGRPIVRIVVIADREPLREIHAVLGVGKVSDAGLTTARLRIEGRRAVLAALTQLTPHLRVHRAKAEEISEVCQQGERRECLVHRCPAPVWSRGLCGRHYARARTADMLRDTSRDRCVVCGTRPTGLSPEHLPVAPPTAPAHAATAPLILCGRCEAALDAPRPARTT